MSASDPPQAGTFGAGNTQPPPPDAPPLTAGPDFTTPTRALVRTSGGERTGEITINGVWVVCFGDDGVWRAWPADDVQAIEWQT